MTAHPTLFLVGQLSCGSDSHIVEFAGYLSADSPYVFYWEKRQCLVSVLLGIDEAAALIALVFLGEF